MNKEWPRLAIPFAALACSLLIAATGFAHDVRIAGPSPGGSLGSTVTALPDGGLFVFGGGTSRSWNSQASKWDNDVQAQQQTRRYWHTATTTTDGRVLLIGGLDSDGTQRQYQENALGSITLWQWQKKMWEVGPGLLTARVAHTASLLPSNDVLVVGGASSAQQGKAYGALLSSVELVGEKTTQARASLKTARAYHTATTLQDGRVVVIGGSDEEEKPLATMEIYDPSKDRWEAGPDLQVARTGHTASLLSDGSVLVVGGMNANGEPIYVTERWSSQSATWQNAGLLAEARADHQATVLSNGDVLISGGTRMHPRGYAGVPALALELWQAELSQWRSAGQIPLLFRDHRAVLGADDRVFLFGSDPYGSSTLVWLPNEEENILVEATLNGTLTRLQDGRFLLAGGSRRQEQTSAALLYDAKANRWTSTRPMHWRRTNHRAVLLHDGRVLVLGGEISGVRTTLAKTDANAPDTPIEFPAEIWDPKTEQWTVSNSLKYVSNSWQEPALLSDGRVMLGATLNDNKYSPSVFIFRIWNPDDDSVSSALQLPRTRADGQALYYADGHLLYMGGSDQVRALTTARCTGDELDSDEEQPRDEHSIEWVSDPCVVTEESARDGKRLDRWDPEKKTWQELRPATLSLNGKTLLPLEDGGVFAWSWPKQYPVAPKSLENFNVWQPTTGWRSLPLPLGFDGGTGMQPHALTNGDLLLQAGGDKTWLWSAADNEWQVIAHDAAWGFTLGMFINLRSPSAQEMDVGDVIAFRIFATSSSGFEKIDVVRLNREAKRWQSVSKGYVSRPYPAMAALPDGQVLVAGGDSRVAQLWQPEKNTWRYTGFTNVRMREPQSLVLKDGSVMVAGVLSDKEDQVACELWQPDTERFTSCGVFPSDARQSRRHIVLRYLDESQILLVHGQQRAMVRKANGEWLATKLQLPKNSAVPVPKSDGTPYLSALASVWNPSANAWEDAVDVLMFHELGMQGYRDDNAVVATWGQGQMLKWDIGAKTLTALKFEPRQDELRLDALIATQDGCLLSWPNRLDANYQKQPTVLLGNSTKLAWLSPNESLSVPFDARGIALADGTVLIAGKSRGASLSELSALRLKVTCDAIAAVDKTAGMYLPYGIATPVKGQPQLQASMPLTPPASLSLLQSWHATWAKHWQALPEHPQAKLVLGALLLFFLLRFFVNRWGAYHTDIDPVEESRDDVRVTARNIDIVIVGVTVPLTIIALGIAIPSVQIALASIASLLAAMSARRLWGNAIDTDMRIAYGIALAATSLLAVAVVGTYAANGLFGALNWLRG